MTDQKPTGKFNFSIRRLFSRFFIAGLLGLLFIFAMIPFMQTGDGLMFEQKAALGADNMQRAVMLWGLFTIIVLLITFWKKRMRMVAVLLCICWLIGVGLLILLALDDSSNKRCMKSSAFTSEREFDRALDLIAQRMDVENTSGTVWNSAFNYRNCIKVEYSDLNTDTGTEGLFLEEDPSLQDLRILINPSYKSFDDLSIATVLTHELIHAGQYVNRMTSGQELQEDSEACFLSEAEAFTGQAVFLNQLNPEEIRSIMARVNQNVDANPAFSILVDIEQTKNEAFTACNVLRTSNALNEQQFNECVWTGTQNKLLSSIKENPFYQAQCK